MAHEAKPLTRIYFSSELAVGARVVLPATAAHHVARVLRLAAGDPVTLFNGAGGEHTAVIAEAGSREVIVEVRVRRELERESPLQISLAQGLSSGERMDYTVQKAVELGVAAIQPVVTARSVVRLAGERAERRIAHWRQVAIAACEQCGRNRVPAVQPLADLRDWLAVLGPQPVGALRLMLAPGAPRRLREIEPPDGGVTLVAGPEGGLAEDERRLLEHAGFLAVSLGPRVLRTETAAVAALAAMQAWWGDF